MEGDIFPIAPLPDSVTSQPPYAYPAADGGSIAPGTTPGIYPGTIGAVDDIASLQNEAITPFLIDATQIAFDTSAGNSIDGGAELSCDQLIGTAGALDGGPVSASGVYQLAQIKTGTLLDGKSYLLAVTGCPAGYTPPPLPSPLNPPLNPTTAEQVCGSDYTGTAPNFAVQIVPLDTTTAIPDGGIGVQFVNFSSSLAGEPFPFNVSAVPGVSSYSSHGPATAGLTPGFVLPPAVVDAGAGDDASDDAGDLGDGAVVDSGAVDSGPPPVVTVLPTFLPAASAPVTYPNGTSTATVVQVDPTQTGIAFGVLTNPGSLPDGGPNLNPFPASSAGVGDLIDSDLNSATGIAGLSDWAATVADGGAPAGFVTGQSYVFVFVGDDNYTLTPTNLGGRSRTTVASCTSSLSRRTSPRSSSRSKRGSRTEAGVLNHAGRRAQSRAWVCVSAPTTREVRRRAGRDAACFL